MSQETIPSLTPSSPEENPGYIVMPDWDNKAPDLKDEERRQSQDEIEKRLLTPEALAEYRRSKGKVVLDAVGVQEPEASVSVNRFDALSLEAQGQVLRLKTAKANKAQSVEMGDYSQAARDTNRVTELENQLSQEAAEYLKDLYK